MIDPQTAETVIAAAAYVPAWAEHMIILPILLPLLAASVMLFFNERRHKIKAAISFTVTLTTLGTGWFLLLSCGAGPTVYQLGNWAAPFGIVLVADHLSSAMVVLTGVLGLCALLFSYARWDRAGPRFHPLFMLLLMGVNGAFLTGDLFNLFVFFEVLLASSYGLALHGSGTPRVRSGMHYIAINLVASSLFLLGASLIYGASGTLNMADIAQRLPDIVATDKGLFNTGVAVLGIAFLAKVGMWPLGFWLPGTYSAAGAPVAAIFAIMSKVGVYAILRMSSLTSDNAADLSGFSSNWIFAGGIATIVYGSVTALSARTLSRVACACVFMSSGTLLCVLGIGTPRVLAGGLYYLMSSTLAIAAFFLLIELVNRVRGTNAAVLADPVFADEYEDPFEDGRIDEEQEQVIIPAAIALLSGGFLICAVLLAGMPPMSGFIGKFAIMVGTLAEKGAASRTAWVFVGCLAFSSLATMVAIVRIGVEVLWVPKDEPPPRVARVEFLSIAGLLSACIALTVMSGPVMVRMDATAASLQNVSGYVAAVLDKPAKPRRAAVPSADSAAVSDALPYDVSGAEVTP